MSRVVVVLAHDGEHPTQTQIAWFPDVFEKKKVVPPPVCCYSRNSVSSSVAGGEIYIHSFLDKLDWTSLEQSALFVHVLLSTPPRPPPAHTRCCCSLSLTLTPCAFYVYVHLRCAHVRSSVLVLCVVYSFPRRVCIVGSKIAWDQRLHERAQRFRSPPDLITALFRFWVDLWCISRVVLTITRSQGYITTFIAAGKAVFHTE